MKRIKINKNGTINEDLTVEEKQNLIDLYRQSEDEFGFKKELLEKLENTQNVERSKKLDVLFQLIWKKIELQKSGGIKIRFFNATKIAAAIVIGLIAGYFLFQNQSGENDYFLAKAPGGSVSQLILPDKSEVYLNAESEIKYKLGVKNSREVYLEGEAWFNIEKNEKQPFIVHTGFYNIQVKGTKFNVKAYKNDDEIVTTLEKGIVEIYSSDSFKIAKTIQMKPGEQVVYNQKTKQIKHLEVNTNWFTSWKDNRLVFINMEFKDLVILLERKYGVDILVTDQSVFNFHYDGTIKNESIFEILDIIKQTLPIKYKIVGQKIEITKK